MVWTHGCFDDLSRFWSADCINHADPSPDTKGLVALRRYHAQFAQVFASFSDVSVDVLQQTAEDDRVVTEMITSAKHTATLNRIAPTGRTMQLATIRIDRQIGRAHVSNPVTNAHLVFRLLLEKKKQINEHTCKQQIKQK